MSSLPILPLNNMLTLSLLPNFQVHVYVPIKEFTGRDVAVKLFEILLQSAADYRQQDYSHTLIDSS